MCRQYFEATVNINQQHDVFELYLDKHFCSDTNPDSECLRVCEAKSSLSYDLYDR